MQCFTNLPREICAAVAALVGGIADKESIEMGEVVLEDDALSIEVYPVGLASAPDFAENEKVALRLTDREPGGAAVCYAGYAVSPKILLPNSPAPAPGEEI